MKMVKDRDQGDDERRWGFVFAIARTWKTADEKMIKTLVTHLPRHLYQRTWIPKEIEGQGRKTFWIYGKRLSLRHIGEVTVVLSKKGRKYRCTMIFIRFGAEPNIFGANAQPPVRKI